MFLDFVILDFAPPGLCFSSFEVKRKRTRKTKTKWTRQAIRCADYQVSRVPCARQSSAVCAVVESVSREMTCSRDPELFLN